jgi:hypothetical protein
VGAVSIRKEMHYMTIVHIAGIDPGIVHTGLVGITLDSEERTIRVLHHVVEGTDVNEVMKYFSPPLEGAQVFIEKYRDRGTVFNTHTKMRAFELALKNALKGSVLLDNTGVKKVVTRHMLDALVGKLPATNHQDLESAARIALYGALKDPASNSVIYHALVSHVGGRPWQRL